MRSPTWCPACQVGDPADESTDVGPLVAQRQQQRVQGYIQSGIDEGAKVVVGGADTAPRPRLVRPADAVHRRHQRHEDRPRGDLRPGADRAGATRTKPTRSGSPTTATTGWPDRCGRPTSRTALEIAAEIRTGTYGINMYQLDTSAPFGGFKQSGIGREFGPEGLSQYTEVQSTVTAGELPLT